MGKNNINGGFSVVVATITCPKNKKTYQLMGNEHNNKISGVVTNTNSILKEIKKINDLKLKLNVINTPFFFDACMAESINLDFLRDKVNEDLINQYNSAVKNKINCLSSTPNPPLDFIERLNYLIKPNNSKKL